MNILQGYCLLALTPYIQLLMFQVYYTLKLVKLQILVQHFQCWCYSYPTSTCLTANTLTSARATSVLTHLIKKAVAYNNLNSKVKNKRVTNGNLLSNELFFIFY